MSLLSKCCDDEVSFEKLKERMDTIDVSRLEPSRGQDEGERLARLAQQPMTSIVAIQPSMDTQLKNLYSATRIKAWFDMMDDPSVQDVGQFITRDVGS